LVYNKTGNKFWKDYEVYINRVGELFALEACRHFV